MSDLMEWSNIVLGLVAIVALGRVIFRQWQTLKSAKISQQKHQELWLKRRANMIESIHLIAMAIEQDQVEHSEGCIRIKGLLDHVKPELLQQPDFEVFQIMYEKTEHMPTHEARRQADRRLIRKLDKERFALEDKYREQVQAAAKAIREHDFGQTVELGTVAMSMRSTLASTARR